MARIAEEEVAHVAVGLYWFVSVCQKMGRAPDSTFKGLGACFTPAYLLTYHHNMKFFYNHRLAKGIPCGIKGSLQLCGSRGSWHSPWLVRNCIVVVGFLACTMFQAHAIWHNWNFHLNLSILILHFLKIVSFLLSRYDAPSISNQDKKENDDSKKQLSEVSNNHLGHLCIRTELWRVAWYLLIFQLKKNSCIYYLNKDSHKYCLKH